MKIGEAWVEIKARMDKYTASLKTAQVQATTATAKIQAQFNKLGITTQSMARTARRGLLVMGAALTGTIYAAAKFEKQMAMVSTMLDKKSMPIMSKYNKLVKKMAVEFGESTQTLSKGLYDILSASVAPEKALSVLADSAKAAAAGITDTGVAADAITTILNSYQMSADRSAEVSDKLFAIVKRGKTTFAELAPSIGKVAATAAIAGLSFDELGATIATLTRAGIRSEEAMTAINNILRAFLKAGPDAKKAAAEFGLELNTNTLRTEGLLGVIKKLNSASAEQLALLFPNIRGLKGMAAALQSAEGYAEDYDLMLHSAGLTQEAFAKQMDTLAVRFKQLKQGAVMLAVAIGNIFTSETEDMVGRLREKIERLTKKINEMSASQKTWAVRITGITLAFTALIAILPALVKGFAALKVVLLGIATPMGAIVAAAAALTAGLTILFSKIKEGQLEDMSETFQGAKEDAKRLQLLALVCEELGVKASTLVGIYGSVEGALIACRESTGKLGEAYKNAIEKQKEMTGTAKELKDAIEDVSNGLDEATRALKDFIEGKGGFHLPRGSLISEEMFGNISGWFTQDLPKAIDVGINWFAKKWEVAIEGGLTGFKKFADGIMQLFSGVSGAFAGTFAQIKGMFQKGGAFGGGAGLGGIMGGIGQLIGMIPGIGQAISALMGTLKSMAKGIARLFGWSPEWEKIGKEVGRDLGVTISEELSKKIAETSKEIGDRYAAISVHIADVMKEVGLTTKNFETFGKRAHDILSHFQTGIIDASTATSSLNDAFSELADGAKELGIRFSRSMIDMIKHSRELGLEIQSITDFVNEKLSVAVDGLSKMIAGMGQSQEEFNRVARVSLAIFNEIIANSGSYLDAVNQLSPLLEELANKQSEWGLEGFIAFDKLQQFANLIETNRALVESVQGMTDAYSALGSIGALTQDLFSDWQSQALSKFNQLIAAGFSQNEALRMLAPTLTALSDAASTFGFSLSDSLAELYGMAKAQDLIKEDPFDKMNTSLDRMVTILEKLARHWGVIVDELEGAADAANMLGGGFDTGGRGKGREMQTGSPYIPKTGWYKLHQGEAVVPKSQNQLPSLSLIMPISIDVLGAKVEAAVAKKITELAQDGKIIVPETSIRTQ